MEKVIYDALNTLNNNGYESFIVGGYVRDYLLGIHSFDIDIATNARTEELVGLFDAKVYEDYGCIKFEKENYDFSITTYRKELSYKNNKPNIIENTNDLYIDATRRDFTINSIYMDKDENIIDPLNARKDIDAKVIKLIGGLNRLNEDKTRILRALRLMTILNFELDECLKEYIIKNKYTIKEINYNKKKSELDKIFSSIYVKKFFDFIEENDMKESFDIDYKEINYNINKDIPTYLLYWAQLEYSESYNFTREEKRIINDIKN